MAAAIFKYRKGEHVMIDPGCVFTDRVSGVGRVKYHSTLVRKGERYPTYYVVFQDGDMWLEEHEITPATETDKLLHRLRGGKL